jgi:hypothetical protein
MIEILTLVAVLAALFAVTGFIADRFFGNGG